MGQVVRALIFSVSVSTPYSDAIWLRYLTEIFKYLSRVLITNYQTRPFSWQLQLGWQKEIQILVSLQCRVVLGGVSSLSFIWWCTFSVYPKSNSCCENSSGIELSIFVTQSLYSADKLLPKSKLIFLDWVRSSDWSEGFGTFSICSVCRTRVKALMLASTQPEGTTMLWLVSFLIRLAVNRAS